MTKDYMLLVLEFTPLKKHFGSFYSFWVLRHCVSLGQSNRSSSHCSDNRLHVALFWEEFGSMSFFSTGLFADPVGLPDVSLLLPLWFIVLFVALWNEQLATASLAAWQLPKHQNGSKPENHQDKTVEVSYLFSALFSCQRSAIRFLTGSRLRIPTLEHLRNLRGLFGFCRI